MYRPTACELFITIAKIINKTIDKICQNFPTVAKYCYKLFNACSVCTLCTCHNYCCRLVFTDFLNILHHNILRILYYNILWYDIIQMDIKNSFIFASMNINTCMKWPLPLLKSCISQIECFKFWVQPLFSTTQ